MAENWILPDNSRGYEPFAKTHNGNLVIEENDVGSPNTRQRSTSPRVFYQFDMYFTPAEWALLFDWVRLNLASGSLPFNFPKPDAWTADTSKWGLYRFAVERMEGSFFMEYQNVGNEIKITTILEGLDNDAN